MSTQEPTYGTTAERLKAFALSDATRDRMSALAARYWEVAAYAFLVFSAAVLRFWNLGARSMHHDESLHGFYGFKFSQALDQVLTFGTANVDTWKHVPFMHGPFQFIGGGFMMWIFGDGEFQARMLAAGMGTAMVFLPFLLRKQLGTAGALAAAAFIAFSPTLLYYSRFTREDIYTAFWTLGIVVFMWRYLASQENKWLYLTAGFMAGSFATKETTYMTVGAFLVFLDYMLARRFADAIRAKQPMSDLQYAGLTIALLPVAWLGAILWPFLEEQRRRYALREMPAEANLLIVMGTLALPMYGAGLQILPSWLGFGEVWQNRVDEGRDLHVHADEQTFAFVIVFFLIGVSVTIGLLWRTTTWAIAAACFWVPYVLLYTTFFSNPDGFMSGIWGSLDYWISQQDVRRGNQPDHYYFVTIPVYEFLPLGLAIAGGLYYMIRGKMSNALIVGGGIALIVLLLLLPNDFLGDPRVLHISIVHAWLPFIIVLVGILTFPIQPLTRFLMYWLVLTALALTAAGEKMPWLNVHIALPLAVLAGRFVGDMLTRSDLRDDLPNLERFAPYLYAATASALALLVFVIVGPFSTASLGGWVLAIVAGVAVFWAFSSYSPRTAMQVALVGVVAAFGVFTIRAGVLAGWGHGDGVPPQYAGYTQVSQYDYGELPVELLVYTQSSSDIPKLAAEIDKYARQTNRGADQVITIDSSDGFTWPWAWYLRNYDKVGYPVINEGFTPEPNAVLLVKRENVQNLRLPDGAYNEGIDYHHRRWFPEEYRGEGGSYSTQNFFRDLFRPSALSNWIDYWVRRTPPAELGTVMGVAFFPADFSADIPTAPIGPTVRTEGTHLVIGGSGSTPGQMNAPSDVAFDAEGNIYVADTNNNRVQKYDPEGNFIASAGGFNSAVQLNQPWSLDVAADGTVFVANTWAHSIVKLDSDLNEIARWGGGGQVDAAGGDPMALFGPREIVVAPSGNVIIADTGNGRVIEYTADGEFVRQFGIKNDQGPSDSTLNEPVGIVVSATGDVFVADYWNRRVVQLDGEFNFVGAFDVPAWGSDLVTNRPYMAILPDGRLLVTDPEHEKVLAYDSAGTLISEFDVPAVSGRSVRPIGIAVSEAHVIVSDASGSVVRKIPLSEILP